VTPRAPAEIREVIDVDWLARGATRLVARHDLDVQAARIAAVSRVDHVGVARIGFHIKDHVAVGPVLDGCIDDDAVEGGARTEHLQSIFMLHPVMGVSLAGAAPGGVGLSYCERTPWRVRQAVPATWKRGDEEEDKDEPE
jgi:hypothetical protein